MMHWKEGIRFVLLFSQTLTSNSVTIRKHLTVQNCGILYKTTDSIFQKCQALERQERLKNRFEVTLLLNAMWDSELHSGIENDTSKNSGEI